MISKIAELLVHDFDPETEQIDRSERARRVVTVEVEDTGVRLLLDGDKPDDATHIVIEYHTSGKWSVSMYDRTSSEICTMAVASDAAVVKDGDGNALYEIPVVEGADDVRPVFKSVRSRFVETVEIVDPDTRTPVELEVRKLETGELVGFDSAYLTRITDDENPRNPYDQGIIIVPTDETDRSE